MITKTIRELITPVADELGELLTSAIERDGAEAKLLGYPMISDTSGFSKGAIIRLCTTLYINAKRKGSKKCDVYLARMMKAFDLLTKDDELRTWGKLSVLTSLLALKDSGELRLIPEKTMSLLREKSSYDDFVDLETLAFKKKLPTNYYHVATECAGKRELLGFEDKGASDIFADKIFSIMKANSGDGWMDEAPPNGRFDIYSIGNNLNMYNTISEIGKTPPDFITENVRKSAELLFAMRNVKGYGISYGRSISMYADQSPIRHLMWALEQGCIPKDVEDEALAYIIHCVERLVGFWYEKEKGLCNIWLDGRSTEAYRAIHRIFETNSEFVIGLCSLLREAERLGIADRLPARDVDEPSEWQSYSLFFVNEKNKKRALYILRRGSHMLNLPLIAPATYAMSGAYMPFPHEPMLLESPPADILMPFLTPKVKMKSGDYAMPAQFYESITDERIDGGIVITAKGRMARLVAADERFVYEPLEAEFTAKYVFDGNTIRMEFDMEDAEGAEILYAGKRVDHVIFPNAKSTVDTDVEDDARFRAPCGALPILRTACFYGGSVICEIKLD